MINVKAKIKVENIERLGSTKAIRHNVNNN